ncbi:MAG TPA: dihydrodipicolinate synthase family protein [Xanthobacteraceae bacterium]|jgi:4-hydroxy-tetrahydrodipicolinate synthase|nr:dihydrodipicolinate synthase family protein [Xanthobacteraceae bacterium]
MKFPGTIVPPLTPFTGDLKVDYKALSSIVNYVVERCDASMVVAAGVEAQEYQYLPFEERKALIQHTVQAVNGRRPVAVGVSHPSFKIAVELAQFAERLDADAIQVLVPQKPTGGAPTTAELVRYFQLIGKETSLPIILYLNPGPGYDASIATTIELAKLDRVKYIKESSRDLARVGRLIAEVELAGHARYFTTMQMLLITLQLGGSGVTLPPPAAELANQIICSYIAGDLARAAELQSQVSLWPARWMEFGLAAVMKATANYLGLPAGAPYPPYAPVSGQQLESLHKFLATMSFHREEFVHA